MQSLAIALVRTRAKYAVIAVVAVLLSVFVALPAFGTATSAQLQTDAAEAETTAQAQTTVSIPTSVAALSTTWIDQTTTLPTGCEITAATMMLDHYGFGATNYQLDDYLVQSGDDYSYVVDGMDYGKDPTYCFVGSTSSEYGWFCYTQPIVNALDSYLQAQGSSMRAVSLAGSSIDDLYAQVAAGNPVTVWVTIGMEERTVSESWYTEDGTRITAATNDHAVSLLGYTAKTVTVADPLVGITTYSRTAFEQAYAARGQMAVVLQGA